MTEQEKREQKLAEQTEYLMRLIAEIDDNIQVIQDAGYTLSSAMSNAIGSFTQLSNLLNNQSVTQGNHSGNLNLIRVLP